MYVKFDVTIVDVYVPTGATGYMYCTYIVKETVAVGREKE